MAGRPRSFDPDEAIGRFVDVFWTRGFDGASIDDLQATVGVRRASFYAAFGDKESAYLAALDRYIGTVTALAMAHLEDAASPLAGLAAFLRFVGDFMVENPGRGCLFFSTVAQRPPVRDGTRARLATIESSIFGRIRAAADAAAAAGDLAPGQTAARVEASVTCSVLGLNAMARAGASPEAIRAAAAIAASTLTATDGRTERH